ncbi:MAG: M50 family metallopeptidase [Bacteroidales bacterium]
MNWITDNPNIVFYVLLITALLLTRIPVLGKYFRSVNTLVHEAGHAFTTLALSGEVIAVNLFADTSGTTVTKAKGKFSQSIIALAGYPVSALTGWLCLFLFHNGYFLYILFILTSIALIIMILSLRNMYGLFWAGTFIVLNLLIIYFNNRNAVYTFSAFYSVIIFTDAIVSSVVLMVLSIRQPKKAGDASNLQKFTKIPAFLWAAVLLAFTLFISWLSVINFFPTIKALI